MIFVHVYVCIHAGIYLIHNLENVLYNLKMYIQISFISKDSPKLGETIGSLNSVSKLLKPGVFSKLCWINARNTIFKWKILSKK